MITLHHLGRDERAFSLNPDLIVTVEANPDTVISLTTGEKILVAESPAQVAHEVRAWRTDILSLSWQRRAHDRVDRPRGRDGAGRLTAVPDTAAEDGARA